MEVLVILVKRRLLEIVQYLATVKLDHTPSQMFLFVLVDLYFIINLYIIIIIIIL
jgi:hypothetical protein